MTTVFRHDFYSSAGLVRSVYVYMLLCQDDGPIYAKVGLSADPRKRLSAIRTSCPVQPRQLFFVGVQSRLIAQRLERELHHAFDRWRAHGEWFELEMTDKPAFNGAWQAVFERFSRPSLPLNWRRMAVPPDATLRRNRDSYLRGMWRKAGMMGALASTPD